MFKSVPLVLIVHNEPEPSPSIDCLQKAQALSLRAGAFELSSVNQGSMFVEGHDQKMFTGIFRWQAS